MLSLTELPSILSSVADMKDTYYKLIILCYVKYNSQMIASLQIIYCYRFQAIIIASIMFSKLFLFMYHYLLVHLVILNDTFWLARKLFLIQKQQEK